MLSCYLLFLICSYSVITHPTSSSHSFFLSRSFHSVGKSFSTSFVSQSFIFCILEPSTECIHYHARFTPGLSPSFMLFMCLFSVCLFSSVACSFCVLYVTTPPLATCKKTPLLNTLSHSFLLLLPLSACV